VCAFGAENCGDRYGALGCGLESTGPRGRSIGVAGMGRYSGFVSAEPEAFLPLRARFGIGPLEGDDRG